MSTAINQLGAIELIELGRTHGNLPVLRRPFLSGPRPAILGPQLGIKFADIGSFLTGAFDFLFTTLADLVNVPADIASSGAGRLFDGLSSVLVNIPTIGVLAYEVLLLAKSIIQWGLSVPGLLLEGIGNIFGEIKDAIDATKTDEEKKKDEDKAKDKILDRAETKSGTDFRNAVDDAISGMSPRGVDDTPERRDDDLPSGADQVGAPPVKSVLEKVLEIGLPVAAAGTLVFLVVT